MKNAKKAGLFVAILFLILTCVIGMIYNIIIITIASVILIIVLALLAVIFKPDDINAEEITENIFPDDQDGMQAIIEQMPTSPIGGGPSPSSANDIPEEFLDGAIFAEELIAEFDKFGAFVLNTNYGGHEKELIGKISNVTKFVQYTEIEERINTSLRFKTIPVGTRIRFSGFHDSGLNFKECEFKSIFILSGEELFEELENSDGLYNVNKSFFKRKYNNKEVEIIGEFEDTDDSGDIIFSSKNTKFKIKFIGSNNVDAETLARIANKQLTSGTKIKIEGSYSYTNESEKQFIVKNSKLVLAAPKQVKV